MFKSVLQWFAAIGLSTSSIWLQCVLSLWGFYINWRSRVRPSSLTGHVSCNIALLSVRFILGCCPPLLEVIISDFVSRNLKLKRSDHSYGLLKDSCGNSHQGYYFINNGADFGFSHILYRIRYTISLMFGKIHRMLNLSYTWSVIQLNYQS